MLPIGIDGTKPKETEPPPSLRSNIRKVEAKKTLPLPGRWAHGVTAWSPVDDWKKKNRSGEKETRGWGERGLKLRENSESTARFSNL